MDCIRCTDKSAAADAAAVTGGVALSINFFHIRLHLRLSPGGIASASYYLDGRDLLHIAAVNQKRNKH